MPDIVNTFLGEVVTALQSMNGVADAQIHRVPQIEPAITDYLDSGMKRLPALFIEDSGGGNDPFTGKYLTRRLRLGIAEAGKRDPLADKLQGDTAELVATALAAFNFATATSALYCNPVSESGRVEVSRDGLAVTLSVIEYDYMLKRS